MSEGERNVGRRTAIGAAWTVALRFSIRGIGLVSTVILARLLVPDDFGLVGLAMMLQGILEVMGRFGFDLALIREPDAGRKHYDTTWTLTLIRNGLVAVILFALAIPATRFFAEPRLEAVIYWVAFAMLLAGFENIGIVDFRKELQFNKDFAFMIVGKVGSFLVTVPLAFLLRSYWALVAGMILGRFFRVVASYVMHSYRPRLSMAAWRELFAFSKWMLVNNIITYLNTRFVPFLIGKVSGIAALGVYNISYEVSNLPTSELAAPVRRALYPGYAKLNKDPKRFAALFLDSLSLMLILGVPLGIGVSLTAEHLVYVFLGAKWAEAIPLIQVLAVYGAITISFGNAGPAIVALGSPRLLAWIKIAVFAVLVPLVSVATIWIGPIGAAWALLAAACLRVALLVITTRRLLDLRLTRVVASTWRIFGATLAMIAGVRALQLLWPTAPSVGTMALQLGAYVACGAIIYCVTLLALWYLSGLPEGAERKITSLIRGRLSRASSAV